MTYLVLGPGGATYGPVDLATLQAWIAQGRVFGTTELLRSDGARMAAMAVPGLNFPGAPPRAPSRAATGVPGFSGGWSPPAGTIPTPATSAVPVLTVPFPGSVTASYACAAFAFFCLPLFPAFIGIVLAGTELRANRAAAMPALVLNVAVFSLHLLGGLFFLLAFSKG